MVKLKPQQDYFKENELKSIIINDNNSKCHFKRNAYNEIYGKDQSAQTHSV